MECDYDPEDEEYFSIFTDGVTQAEIAGRIGDKKTAEFIVRACNNHSELLAALEKILALTDLNTNTADAKRLQIRKMKELAGTAISKAKGETI